MVAILLCVAMAVVSLVACGNSNKANDKDNVSVSLDSETDTLNNTNSPKAEQKEDQIDYIQAEYRIIDAKELYVTADNLEATTDSDGNETYINTKEIDKFNEICLKYQAQKNSFDGYKMMCTDLVVDVWRIEQTWAYRENVIECQENDYLRNLTQTVFYNMDSIVYDIKKDMWYDDVYKKAKENNVLDIVLEENPYIDLNILRGMILQSTYDMKYSSKIKNIVRDRYQQENNYEKLLYDIEIKRYKREILSLDDIKNQLYRIVL